MSQMNNVRREVDKFFNILCLLFVELVRIAQKQFYSPENLSPTY
jgi:hypothetical protein